MKIREAVTNADSPLAARTAADRRAVHGKRRMNGHDEVSVIPVERFDRIGKMHGIGGVLRGREQNGKAGCILAVEPVVHIARGRGKRDLGDVVDQRNGKIGRRVGQRLGR